VERPALDRTPQEPVFKVVVIQPGQPEREILVEGQSALVGRLDSCDVVLDKPFVSKQHVRLLYGIVAVDLGSSNGTYLNGRKLSEPALLEGGKLVIGQNGIELRVEGLAAGDTQPASAPAPAPAEAEAELENLRSRFALMELEAAKLRRELAQLREGGAAVEEPARLRGENQSLRERLESLKRELEEREQEDGASVQARLARDRMASAQELNEKLQLENDRLRAELRVRPQAAAAAPAASGPDADADSLRAELERSRGESESLRAELKRQMAAARAKEDQTDLVRKLRAELEALRSAALPSAEAPAVSPDLEAALEEGRALKARVAELEGRLAAAGPPQGAQVSDLFFKLQSENAELKRKLAALEKAPAKGGASAQRDSAGRLVKDLMEARLRITALEAEISHLKVQTVSGVKLPKGAKPAPAERPAAAPVAGGVRGILQVVASKDIEGLPRTLSGPAEEFVVAESVRLLRNVERVVTRVAGDLIQLFQLQTMLPDTQGNYRIIVAELLADANDRGARDRLVAYLETLGRWLVASIGAHRKAALLFAEGLKAELSQEGLTADEPLPAVKRVAGLAGVELWRRAQQALKQLTPQVMDERIDALAREQAQQILGGKS
jgi:pSer/pThr/pTyr-binding forkhead associated (FHA) protein